MNELTKQEKNPMTLMELAIDKGADIEKLEKLMNLQERWEAKEAKKLFYQAMADYEKQKPDIKKSKEVAYNKTAYSYAPLNVIQKALDPIISQFGLSYRFEQKEEGAKIKIICIVTHESGHSELTELSAPLDTSGSKNSIQAIGSTITYLKRYTLENAFGLSSGDDDDGQAAPDLQTVKNNELLLKIVDLFLVVNIEDAEAMVAIQDIILKRKSNNYIKTLTYLEGLQEQEIKEQIKK